MSDLGLQFVLAARRMTLVEEIEPVIHQAQSQYMRFCSVCLEIMPHVRKEDRSECTVCGLPTFPESHANESESGR
jgi:rRNA maturation endonuclease Nob1